MRLSIVKKKTETFYYVLESIPGGSTRTYEIIGKHSDLLKITDDPKAYAQKRVDEINSQLKHDIMVVSEHVDFSEPLVTIDDDIYSKSLLKNIGWFYLNEIMKSLEIDQFFSSIQGKQKYPLSVINRHLVINQILSPSSKLNALNNIEKYMSMESYDLHQSYRFLSDLNEHKEEFQAYLFKKTKEIVNLDTNILMYDLTNFYFETEEEDIDFLDGDNILQYGFRKYGKSKEHRPNPIVHMGLFVDKNGIPISFTVEKGNTSEKDTVLPIEHRIIKDYGHSKFIYCADGGLNSYAIRFFNLIQGRNYVVTQSLKRIEDKEKALILKDKNWKFKDNNEKTSLYYFKSLCDKVVNGETLTVEEEKTLSRDIIYKVYPLKHNVEIAKIVPGAKGTIDFEESVFVTFSAKYYLYQHKVFTKQLSRAEDWIKKGKDKRKNQNDPSRFIKESNFTKEGELIGKSIKEIDKEVVCNEEELQGFYAVATNLNASIKDVLAINSNRWIIEYCFRILKSFFETRPMYVYTEEHIKGHLTICYEALLIFQILSFKLKEKGSNYSISNILTTLKNLKILNHNDKYYEASYTNSCILKSLEEIFHLDLNKKNFKINKFKKI